MSEEDPNDLTIEFKAAMERLRDKKKKASGGGIDGDTIEYCEDKAGFAIGISKAERRECGQVEVRFRFFRLSNQEPKRCGGLQVFVQAETGRTSTEVAYLECRKALQKLSVILTDIASLAHHYTRP